jgi:hypothetical protein
MEISLCEKKLLPNFKHHFLGGLVVSVLAIAPKVRGLKRGRGRCIFKGDNNP